MNKIDEIFQSKLENHTVEYSPQAWDNIQARLNKEDKKPKNFPWVWIGIGTLLVGALAYLLVPRESVDGLMPKDIIIEDTNEHITHNEKSVAETAYIASNDKLSSTVNDVTKLNNQKDEILDKVNSVANGTIADAVNDSWNKADNTIAEDEIEVRKSSMSVSSPNELDSVQKQKSVSDETYISNNIINSSSEVSSMETNATMAATSHDTDTDMMTEPKSTVSNANTISSIRPIRTIGVSQFSILSSEKETETIELSPSILSAYRQDCPSFVTDRTGVYFDFYMSHEMPFMSLSTKNEELESYKELRNSTESPSYSFSAGARITLMLPNGLGLKTGLNYSQINQKFSYLDTDSDMVYQIVTCTPVDGVVVKDTNVVVVPGTRDIVSMNKYKSIDIPLLLSYEWDVRDRMYMAVNGGIYLNLLFKDSGKILNPEGEVIDLDNLGNDQMEIFKSNVGLSLFGSVGLHYRWTSNIDLILEPNARLLMKSVTNDSYALDQKWITVGLITGFRYNF